MMSSHDTMLQRDLEFSSSLPGSRSGTYVATIATQIRYVATISNQNGYAANMPDRKVFMRLCSTQKSMLLLCMFECEYVCKYLGVDELNEFDKNQRF